MYVADGVHFPGMLVELAQHLSVNVPAMLDEWLDLVEIILKISKMRTAIELFKLFHVLGCPS